MVNTPSHLKTCADCFGRRRTKLTTSRNVKSLPSARSLRSFEPSLRMDQATSLQKSPPAPNPTGRRPTKAAARRRTQTTPVPRRIFAAARAKPPGQAQRLSIVEEPPSEATLNQAASEAPQRPALAAGPLRGSLLPRPKGAANAPWGGKGETKLRFHS